ncbi:response regulator [Sulfuricella sp.]|uniref:response regulator n=1 Tax=Sulfuricella sp. TaxID=2099377 RepID=UPI002C0E5D17|nr:response regulator [Sulfuricella sp.]HUX64133.1 response regulator [Sulfuricella sp.]
MLDEVFTAGATILVVDDAPPNVKLLRLILKDAGYRVLEAGSGPEALETLRREKPDAMVLDVRMPGMTGYEVCREIRHDPEFAALPVIMVTALSLAEERIRGIEAGATDFISKPFNKKELLARIQSSLALAKLGMNGIIHQLPGAVVITDPAWRIIGMSPLATILLGIPEPGLMVLNFTELLGQAEKDQVVRGDLPAEFSLRVPVTRSSLDARQVEVFDPAGHPLLRLITLREAVG